MSDCLGGFTYAGRKHAPELQVGEEVGLGLCEGHGAVVVLGRSEKGLYHRHVPVKGYEEHTPDELLADHVWSPATSKQE